MTLSIFTLTLFALLMLSNVAAGELPDCLQSTIDPPARLGRSPKNVEVGDPDFQYTLSFTVRNAAGTPILGWSAADVTLEVLAPCQNPFGPLNPGPGLVWDAARLDRPGGSCTGANVVRVRLISANCTWYLNSVTSPDEDGNGSVALADLSIFQQAFVAGGPFFQGDLNLSGGFPDLGDLLFFQKHFTAPN